ncbi:hypothetical protein NQ317_019021 [Molorchus minor]|uniref:Uncharacterized protein n=1 Tax=Molorchus minor TaxID=1323400 RepID=A0ABQ9J4S5_9CUCU|nr:hypothetical protein NQ317_019021 [Molorchus minor]
MVQGALAIHLATPQVYPYLQGDIYRKLRLPGLSSAQVLCLAFSSQVQRSTKDFQDTFHLGNRQCSLWCLLCILQEIREALMVSFSTVIPCSDQDKEPNVFKHVATGFVIRISRAQATKYPLAN